MLLRLRLLCAVLWSTVLVLGGNSAYAGQVDQPGTSLELRANTIKHSSARGQQHLGDLSQSSARRSEPAHQARQVSVADLVRNLVSDSKPSNTKAEGLVSLAVEPWMPGRGSLGVKVELNW